MSRQSFLAGNAAWAVGTALALVLSLGMWGVAAVVEAWGPDGLLPGMVLMLAVHGWLWLLHGLGRVLVSRKDVLVEVAYTLWATLESQLRNRGVLSSSIPTERVRWGQDVLEAGLREARQAGRLR